MVVVGALVAGIIGLPVQVVGLVGQEVPSNMVVVDLLMEAMVEGEVVGMVEVEVIRLVEVVSKGGGNCANTSMQPLASTGHTKRRKNLKKSNLTSPPSLLYPASLSHHFPSSLTTILIPTFSVTPSPTSSRPGFYDLCAATYS